MIIVISQAMKFAPKKPGVYIFRKGKLPLYIGKAVDLRNRLSFYFRRNTGEKVRQMRKEATKIEWIETASEIEALIKEAELIKKYKPKYNYIFRDDKNYSFVGLTKEIFPKIYITHQPHTDNSLKLKTMRYIGPFTDGTALKHTLKLIRKILPYCTCKKPHRRPCLNTEMGRCLGCCCVKNAIIETRSYTNCLARYKENIKNIIGVLSGKKRDILRHLRKEMYESARLQKFERAAVIRNQIKRLENIFSHQQFLEVQISEVGLQKLDQFSWRKIEEYIRHLLGVESPISRVEGYDISNISGTEATGSMVVFIAGKPSKSDYKKFKIKTVYQPDDIGMLKEVISRRLRHREWQYPDMMIIDGGKGQFNAAKVQVAKHQAQIIVAALAKQNEELYTDKRNTPILLENTPPGVMHFFQQVRDEAHRFAKKYHHKLREKRYREKINEKR